MRGPLWNRSSRKSAPNASAAIRRLQAARSDTLLMRQGGQDPGWFEKATAIAGGAASFAWSFHTGAARLAAGEFASRG